VGAYKFRFVGTVTEDAARLHDEIAHLVEFVPRREQARLPDEYAWADVFLFPTLQDGFAVVLSQAQGACLPVLSTTNCSGRDLIEDGKTGWVLPIRSPRAFMERLEWCRNNRNAVAEMVTRLAQRDSTRDWNDVAREFEYVVAGIARQRNGQNHC
jgi:glycosyltransferase involved in cell wall biosynthesis